MPARLGPVAQIGQVRLHLSAILLLGVIGRDLEMLVGLHVHQDGRPVQRRTHILGVEDVEQHHLVAAVTQRLDGADNALGRFPEIGDDQHDAAALEELLEVAHGLGEIGAGARLGLFQAGQQTMQLALPRGRPDDSCGSRRRR